MNVDELKKTAHEAIDRLIDDMVRRNIAISCPDFSITTYDEGEPRPRTFFAEVLERADGTWNIEDIDERV